MFTNKDTQHTADTVLTSEQDDCSPTVSSSQNNLTINAASPHQMIPSRGSWNKTQISSREKISEMMECLEHNSKNYPSKANICKGIGSSTCINTYNSQSSNSPIVNYYSPIEQKNLLMRDSFHNNNFNFSPSTIFNHRKNSSLSPQINFSNDGSSNQSPSNRMIDETKTLQEKLEGHFTISDSYSDNEYDNNSQNVLSGKIEKKKESDSESSEEVADKKALYMLSFNSDDPSDEDKQGNNNNKEQQNNYEHMSLIQSKLLSGLSNKMGDQIENEMSIQNYKNKLVNNNTTNISCKLFNKKTNDNINTNNTSKNNEYKPNTNVSNKPTKDNTNIEYEIKQNVLTPTLTTNNTFSNTKKKQPTYNNNNNYKKQYQKIKRIEPSTYIDVPLDKLIPNIHSLGTDQGGCRYLQKIIETNPADSVTLLYKPLLNYLHTLSNDAFGNYLIQKLILYLTPSQLSEVISLYNINIYDIGTNPHGTRVLQNLINHLSTDELKEKFFQSLKPMIVPLLKDLNGTHIVQKFANDYPKYSPDIDNIIIENCSELASNRHGCCVIQHYFKQYKGDLLEKLINKIINDTLILIPNQFGNYVMQSILAMNNVKYGNAITSKIAGNISYYAKHKYSSNVVEKCFDHCDDKHKNELISNLNKPDVIKDLLLDEHGNYIIQKALMCCDAETQKTILEIIIPLIDQLKGLAFGERIINRLYKSYPKYFGNESNMYNSMNNKDYDNNNKKGKNKYNKKNQNNNNNSKRYYNYKKKNPTFN